MKHIVIIGGGHAGGQLIASLRQQQFSGKITLISGEDTLPYHRPPLSKDYLTGDKSDDQIALFADIIYQDEHTRCLLNCSVNKIDTASNSVSLSDDTEVGYDYLVFTTGSQLRKLDIPGTQLSGIHYLKTIEDARRIQTDMQNASSMVVVGGGYIGLEIAASARRKGLDVTVLEMAPRILQRVVAPEVSEYITRIHQQQGVNIMTGSSVQEFKGNESVAAVAIEGGKALPADIVIIGVGVLPNDTLAQEAGLICDNGIRVNEYCQTSIENIYAAGDCANFYHNLYQRRLRLESVQNAVDQAKTIAASITGLQQPYDAIPWFWSNQFNLKLQIAGLSQGFDQLVVRGNTKKGSVAFYYLQDSRVIACDAVNSPIDFMISKKLIAQRISIDANLLSNPEVPVKSLLAP